MKKLQFHTVLRWWTSYLASFTNQFARFSPHLPAKLPSVFHCLFPLHQILFYPSLYFPFLSILTFSSIYSASKSVFLFWCFLTLPENSVFLSRFLFLKIVWIESLQFLYANYNGDTKLYGLLWTAYTVFAYRSFFVLHANYLS